MADSYYTFLRKLTDKYPQIFQNGVIYIISRQIADAGVFYIRLSTLEKWQNKKITLLQEAKNLLNLPYFYINNAQLDGIYNGKFELLCQAITKIGIAGFIYNVPEMGKEAGKVLMELANTALPMSNDSFIHRVVKLACYIGIFALAKGETHWLIEFKSQVIEFQDAYKQKFLSNIPDGVRLPFYQEHPLEAELARLRSTLQESTYPYSSSLGLLTVDIDSLMHQYVTINDFDRFTAKIWGYYNATSPIASELNAEIQAQQNT
jgi:hypothetical protein